MRLTLILDGDIGTPVGEQNIGDHPDKATLQSALDAIGKAAQVRLVDEPAALAKAEEEAAQAETEEEAQAIRAKAAAEASAARQEAAKPVAESTSTETAKPAKSGSNG